MISYTTFKEKTLITNTRRVGRDSVVKRVTLNR